MSLARAAWNSLSRGTRAGASTITCNGAAPHHRIRALLAGKLRHYLCLELERLFEGAILEASIWLPTAELEGRAPPGIYFSKTAARISGPEAVALSVIPQTRASPLTSGRENDRLPRATPGYTQRRQERRR